jgi:hypothetical protein
MSAYAPGSRDRRPALSLSAGSLFVLALLAGLALVSCEEGPPTEPSSEVSLSTTADGLVPDSEPVFEGGFETGDISQWDGTDLLCCGHSATVGTERTSSGDYAARIELREEDRVEGIASGSRRAEVRKFGLGQGGEEWWYEISYYIPPDWTLDPDHPETVAQWQKRTGNGDLGSPPLELTVDGDRCTWPCARTRTRAAGPPTSGTAGGRRHSPGVSGRASWCTCAGAGRTPTIRCWRSGRTARRS